MKDILLKGEGGRVIRTGRKNSMKTKFGHNGFRNKPGTMIRNNDRNKGSVKLMEFRKEGVIRMIGEPPS